MLKTFLVSSLLLTLILGATGASAAASWEISPGELTRQLNLEREQVQSSVQYQFQNQVQGQLSLGPAANSTETTVVDCDGTPDRGQDQLQDRDQDQAQDHLQDRDQDRIHQIEPDGTASQHRTAEENGSRP